MLHRFETTLASSVQCHGIGLHSGQNVRLGLHPAEAGSGIIFVRLDVKSNQGVVAARYDRVTDTRLGTRITNEQGVCVSTIEHLMAAFWGMGVDNALVTIDGPEVPIMDGSSEPFVALIRDAGTRALATPRRYIEVLDTVTVREGESVMTLSPHAGFALDVEILFSHQAIARQTRVFDSALEDFSGSLSRARTFGFAHEVEQLRTMGLARGGSLENAIVIGEQGVLNREGLRYNDEFVRHKALDCVGDLYLAGHPLLAHVGALRPGHSINNALLRALFAQAHAWRFVTLAPAASYKEPARATAGRGKTPPAPAESYPVAAYC